MGVDAKMAVRLRGNKLTHKQINRLAGDMVATLGEERFWIRGKSMFAKEYPQVHALSSAPTLAEYCAEYEDDNKWVLKWRQEVAAMGWTPETAQVVMSDVDGLYAGPDEQLLEVGLRGRYYGVGYERGHWPHYREVAEFLEKRLPGCEIFYGGDSGGLERCDASYRAAMDDHFYTVGHAPYRGGFGSFRGRPLASEHPVCGFCGDRPMHDCGGGPNKVFWHCDGCNEDVVVKGQEWWTVKRDRDLNTLAGQFNKDPDAAGRRPLSEMRSLATVRAEEMAGA